MRTIEKKMLAAIESGKEDWSLDNTRVMAIVGGFEVQLHGNRIATVDEYGSVKVDVSTLKRWPSNTTKSRLRALGCNVQTKKGEIYLDGVKI
jgi:hypothetical protein